MSRSGALTPVGWRSITAALLCGSIGLAPAAGGDGGWALWGQTADPWNAIVLLPLGAWPTRAQCEEEKAKREEGPEELRMAAYTCLPDTVDPRLPQEPGADPGASRAGDTS